MKFYCDCCKLSHHFKVSDRSALGLFNPVLSDKIPGIWVNSACSLLSEFCEQKTSLELLFRRQKDSIPGLLYPEVESQPIFYLIEETDSWVSEDCEENKTKEISEIIGKGGSCCWQHCENFRRPFCNGKYLPFCWFWSFHYRITVAVLLIGVALVSSKEYIGEHIKCLYSHEKKEWIEAVERFCFFMATFTVVKLHNKSVLNLEVAHPGVGPYIESEDDIIKHAYYQWVPFLLFFQAICFCLPHIIWREIEKGKMKALLNGLKEIDMINTSFKRKSFDSVQLHFKNRLYINRSWAFSLIACEILNLLNLIFQVYITDVFLGYQFMDLGPKVYWDPKGDEFNPLDVVFPKVTKCTFRKFGPSGTIQYHDIMCVMALNIVNEKVYAILWFWYVILFILSVSILIWRVISFILRKSIYFNIYVFKLTALGNIDQYNLITVMRHLSFGEWMFLRYLASNMPARLFDDLLAQIADSYENDYQPPEMIPEKEKPLEKQEEEEYKKPLVDL